MLISSAFLSSTAWGTDQLQNPGAIEPPKTSPRPPRHVEQQKQAETREHASGTSVSARRRDRTDEAVNHENGSHAEPHSRHERRVHAKQHKQTEPAQSVSADSSESAANNTEPAGPFRAILTDVLPKEAPMAAEDAGNMANQPAAPAPKLPLAMGLPGTTASAIPANEAQAASQQAPDGSASQAAVKAAPQEQANERLDPSFAITKEPVATAASAGSPQTAKTPERGDVAFAARIAERPAQAAALTFHDAETVIAASRFEAPASGGQSGGGPHADPRGAGPAHQQVSAGVSAETATPPPAGGEPAAESNPQLPAVSESAGGRPGIVPTGSRAPVSASANMAAAAALPAAGPHGTVAAQNSIPGLAAAASGPTAAGGRNPEAKNAEGSAPQFIEPSNEEHAAESVRDISLRLTNKDQSSVQVRLSERAGELHVSVRTPDTGLTRGLRDGLSDLVGRLENSGYRAETWQPAGSGSFAGQDQSHDSSSRGGQQQNAGGSGSGTGQQQNARDQQQPDGQTPKWLSELESNFQRSDKTWLPSATR